MDPRPLRWLRMTLPIVNRSSVELQVSKDDRGRRGKRGDIYLAWAAWCLFREAGCWRQIFCANNSIDEGSHVISLGLSCTCLFVKHFNGASGALADGPSMACMGTEPERQSTVVEINPSINDHRLPVLSSLFGDNPRNYPITVTLARCALSQCRHFALDILSTYLPMPWKLRSSPAMITITTTARLNRGISFDFMNISFHSLGSVIK